MTTNSVSVAASRCTAAGRYTARVAARRAGTGGGRPSLEIHPLCTDDGGQVLVATAPRPGIVVGRAVRKPRPTRATSAECRLLAGGPHHTVLGTAVGREARADRADVFGVEPLVIDAATDQRSFANHLRWNGSYHRLDQRLQPHHKRNPRRDQS